MLTIRKDKLYYIVAKWKLKGGHHVTCSQTQHRLLGGGTLRFGELKDAVPGITQKTLTAALRSLEAEELLTRKVYAVIPPKVEYTLTTAGQELLVILEALGRWQEKYRPAEGKEQ